MKATHRNQFVVAAVSAIFSLGCTLAVAQVPPPPSTRTPQPLPPASAWTYTTSPDGFTTYVSTPTGNFPQSDPSINPTNLLPTVYANVNAANGVPIPNTLSSTPAHPYNLHADPTTVPINPTSPTDDLAAIFLTWRQNFDPAGVRRAIDILEGNPVPNRLYSGIPMIHYNGPNKVKAVVPTYDANGNVTGGNVTVHQIWFDTHIESDTAFIDPSAVMNVPFTITYVVDCMNKGKDDFAPMQMYLDDPLVVGKGVPLVTMDMTFFPMQEGTRTTFVMNMAPGRFFNLTYNWGWREHPPRVQVAENALKVAMGKTLPQWEIDTFGANPRASQSAKLAAIGMIGNLAPSKRMWTGLYSLLQTGFNPTVMAQVERAFGQWQQRNQLPDGVAADPAADVTLFYVDNTIYGQMSNYVTPNAQAVLDKWRTRGTTATIKLINGDYYQHAYVSVDFGGLRGWENTFQNTIPIGGDGPWFTFGRAYWEMNTPTPILVPAATAAAAATPTAVTPTATASKTTMNLAAISQYKMLWQDELDPLGKSVPTVMPAATLPTSNGDTLGVHTVVLTLNYEPSLRLRLYQFDPLHHEMAIWSVH